MWGSAEGPGLSPGSATLSAEVNSQAQQCSGTAAKMSGSRFRGCSRCGRMSRYAMWCNVVYVGHVLCLSGKGDGSGGMRSAAVHFAAVQAGSDSLRDFTGRLSGHVDATWAPCQHEWKRLWEAPGRSTRSRNSTLLVCCYSCCSCGLGLLWSWDYMGVHISALVWQTIHCHSCRATCKCTWHAVADIGGIRCQSPLFWRAGPAEGRCDDPLTSDRGSHRCGQ